MSTLELKSSSTKDKDSSTSKKSSSQPLKIKPKGRREAAAPVAVSDSNPSLALPPSGSSSKVSGARILSSATGSLVFDLESLHQKMNSMLCRASQATVQEEDESDVKMRQLLEEIYSSSSSSFSLLPLQEDQQQQGEGEGEGEEGETEVGRGEESSFRGIF
jgi:hypothetical protein